MPTENRRVAAYLPKEIDDRLEAFKIERRLKGDSQALIVILEEYFGVSREVAHLNEPECASLLYLVESVIAKVARLEDELLGELRSRPHGDLKSELLGELQGELFDRLKPDLKSELLSELKSELLNTPTEIAVSPGQLNLIPAERVEQSPISGSKPLSELPNELLNPVLDKVDHPFDQISLVSPQEVDQVAPGDSESLYESSELNSKPLDGSIAWTGVELSQRLKAGTPQLAAFKNKSDEQLAEWSRKKDPDGLAWKRVGRGKYVPITNDHQDF